MEICKPVFIMNYDSSISIKNMEIACYYIDLIWLFIGYFKYEWKKK